MLVFSDTIIINVCENVVLSLVKSETKDNERDKKVLHDSQPLKEQTNNKTSPISRSV